MWKMEMKNHYYYICRNKFPLRFLSGLASRSPPRNGKKWVGGWDGLTWLGEWTSVCYRKYIKFKQNSLCYYLSLTHTDTVTDTGIETETQNSKNRHKWHGRGANAKVLAQNYLVSARVEFRLVSGSRVPKLRLNPYPNPNPNPNFKSKGLRRSWPLLPRCILNSSGRRIW